MLVLQYFSKSTSCRCIWLCMIPAIDMVFAHCHIVHICLHAIVSLPILALTAAVAEPLRSPIIYVQLRNSHHAEPLPTRGGLARGNGRIVPESFSQKKIVRMFWLFGNYPGHITNHHRGSFWRPFQCNQKTLFTSLHYWTPKGKKKV